jgi:cell division protein ZapD
VHASSLNPDFAQHRKYAKIALIMMPAQQPNPVALTIDGRYYEQPLNERIRVFLRLEKLFQQFAYHIQHGSEWSHQVAIDSLIELVNFTGRSDIKLEALKELERQHARLERLVQRPQIDQQQLGALLKNIEERSAELKNSKGQLGQELQNIELLASIRQKSSVPGCVCSFDLPAMSFWQGQDESLRQQHLKQWFEPFKTLDHALQLILEVLRSSTENSDEVAHSGFFQQAMNTNQAVQLLRIAVSAQSECYPEISAGKHRFSVRFMSNKNPASRPEQCQQDIHFKLGMCAF